MLKEKNCTWFDAIKEDLCDRLEELLGEERYPSDLGFELTISENNTGSWYCSTYKAREEIGEHWLEFGLIAEYMRDNWEDTTNPLLDPELFHVRAMICLYDCLFAHAAYTIGNQDDYITIDADYVDAIRDALENVLFCDIF